MLERRAQCICICKDKQKSIDPCLTLLQNQVMHAQKKKFNIAEVHTKRAGYLYSDCLEAISEEVHPLRTRVACRAKSGFELQLVALAPWLSLRHASEQHPQRRARVLTAVC